MDMKSTAEYITSPDFATFDERNKKVARDTISIMKEAGLMWYLGMQEVVLVTHDVLETNICSVAETNLATFEEIGVRRL